MAYDEMELDMLGDQRTAMFVIISDTDDTFNFVVSILYTQLFNLLCDKADDEHGGRLPYHVRLLLDEFANILNVLLKNKGFDTIARKNMDRKQTGRYDAYNLTYGNRPELFGAGSPTYSGGTTGSIGSGGSGGTGGSSGGGFRYDIPEEALSDEKFARMIAEAEKYLGMPYVWGGSSPSTSFDCSGFVCWVINNCGNGWNVGRTTANGLRGKCSYVSPANAQPGDLIFFEKTYNTVGASHVGIYVGNGMMIHCGDPISYTSINSTYWQNHFLGFGRIK